MPNTSNACSIWRLRILHQVPRRRLLWLALAQPRRVRGLCGPTSPRAPAHRRVLGLAPRPAAAWRGQSGSETQRILRRSSRCRLALRPPPPPPPPPHLRRRPAAGCKCASHCMPVCHGVRVALRVCARARVCVYACDVCVCGAVHACANAPRRDVVPRVHHGAVACMPYALGGRSHGVRARACVCSMAPRLPSFMAGIPPPGQRPAR